MANPIRLYRLTELREQAGLTLADMAECCGLRGNQSRKAVSAWEAGTAMPRTNRRLPFVRYLWHDLQLYKEPATFEEVWTMLVEEWAWEPLTAAERVQLLVKPSPPLLTAVAVATDEIAVAPVALPTEPPAPSPTPPLTPDVDPPLPETLRNPVLLPSRLAWLMPMPAQRRWLLIVLPLLLFLIGGGVWWQVADPVMPPAVADVGVDPATINALADLSATAAITATSGPLVLTNGGFDLADNFTGWNLYEVCDYQIITDATLAQQGERYLTIKNRQARCYSFYQDVFTSLEVGATYRAAIWLRSATGHPRRGRLALWALDAGRELSETSFAVDNLAWTCLETTLTPKQPGHQLLKVELYLTSADGLDYHFDSATLSQGPESLCPPAQLAIADLRLVQPSGQIYAGANVGVQAMVKNVGATALTAESFIRYWIAEADEGGPFDVSVNRILAVPPLAAGESATITHVDLGVPLNLLTDQTYFVVADVAATNASGDFTPGFDRASLPFTVTPCSQGTLYCDVAADHWAAAEIQAWFDGGISQGCRSNTEPFVNRPFCPDALVQRWMMAVFLFRRLEGKDYQPTNGYQGLFEDVPEDFDSHKSALRIEALTTKRVDLTSEACPPRGEHRRFCPNDPIRRVDFARALADLQRWDLNGVAGTLFADMPAGSEEARIAEYMAQQGFLPANDTDCPDNASYPRFCSNDPLRRASAALMMSRALGLVEPTK